ncbi:hypothetical protein GIB67_014025 [Kingdonia uniflora]|uniref:DUF7887 domain-containing protein n=1 Tax=Kingdonia uniflora TaxID=39325 RepID=A0A7J7L5J0_9MAGN|nr:hypothetical protein GIB67_014025 [Kingdonia uniflora]
MVITQSSIIPISSLHPYLLNRNGRNFKHTAFAKKKDLTENLKPKQEFILRLRVPNVLLAQSAIAVLGLGFIDAGYSGDWSRIGAISKESENLLKIAAFGVVPLCIFLMFSFSKEEK